MSILTAVRNYALVLIGKPNVVGYAFVETPCTDREFIALASVIYNAASDEQKKQITGIKK